MCIRDRSKGNFNPISINDISNGIIALKGGDVTEELLGIEQKKIVDIKNFFDIHYFIDKKIVYVSS